MKLFTQITIFPQFIPGTLTIAYQDLELGKVLVNKGE